MADIFTIIATAIDRAERLRKVVSNLKNLESNELIADLRNDLVDLKGEIAKLKEENQRLHVLAQRKSGAEGFRSLLKRKNDVFVLTEDAEGYEADTAFCPRCVEADGKLMALIESPGPFQMLGRLQCPDCETFYQSK